MIEREEALLLISTKNLVVFAEKLRPWNSYSVLKDDDIFLKIIDDVFIGEMERARVKDKDAIIVLSQLMVYHRDKKHSFNFSERLLNSVVLLMLEYGQDYHLAMEFPNLPLSKQIINEEHIRREEEISLNLKKAKIRKSHTLKEIEPKSKESYKKSIFNSLQEEEFYKAFLRSQLNGYRLFPNFALSTLCQFDEEENLTPAEKNFAFKATLDFVLTNSKYEVLKIVELDSSFHDTHSARKNDSLKDRIASKIGVKLIRLRPKGDIQNTDYAELVGQLDI